jgi:hypothetical protein
MKNLFAFLGAFAFLTQAYAALPSEDVELQNDSDRTITITRLLDESNPDSETQVVITPGEIKMVSLTDYLNIMIALDDGTIQKKRLPIKGKTGKKQNRSIRVTDNFIRNQFGLNR